MSMSCFVKVENDITELKQYTAIENLQIELLKMELILNMIHQKLKYLMVERHTK